MQSTSLDPIRDYSGYLGRHPSPFSKGRIVISLSRPVTATSGVNGRFRRRDNGRGERVGRFTGTAGISRGADSDTWTVDIVALPSALL